MRTQPNQRGERTARKPRRKGSETENPEPKTLTPGRKNRALFRRYRKSANAANPSDDGGACCAAKPSASRRLKALEPYAAEARSGARCQTGKNRASLSADARIKPTLLRTKREPPLSRSAQSRALEKTRRRGTASIQNQPSARSYCPDTLNRRPACVGNRSSGCWHAAGANPTTRALAESSTFAWRCAAAPGEGVARGSGEEKAGRLFALRMLVRLFMLSSAAPSSRCSCCRPLCRQSGCGQRRFLKEPAAFTEESGMINRCLKSRNYEKR